MSVRYPSEITFGLTRKCGGHKGTDLIEEVPSSIKFSPKLSFQRYVMVTEVLVDFCRKSGSRTSGNRNCVRDGSNCYSDGSNCCSDGSNCCSDGSNGCSDDNTHSPLRRVTEFGSGSFDLLCRCLHVHDFFEIVDQVEIDHERIISALHTVAWDSFRPSCRSRTRPLTVNVFCGDATVTDSRICNSDAVVAVEVIEHLDQQQLERFVAVIFDFIRPALVVFTTPNYDFNVLFESGGFDGGNGCRYRHHDHKFEFTRRQFENWTEAIVERYAQYQVDIYGIGDPPSPWPGDDDYPGFSDVGLCTQMAVFKKLSSPTVVDTPPAMAIAYHESYKLVDSYRWS